MKTCKGRNCSAVRGVGHSKECLEDYEKTIHGEHPSQQDSKCPQCGRERTWCDTCRMWSSTCCEEHGTCECS